MGDQVVLSWVLVDHDGAGAISVSPWSAAMTTSPIRRVGIIDPEVIDAEVYPGMIIGNTAITAIVPNANRAVASGTLSTPGITETAWQPAVPGTDESRWYEITVTLDSAAPNTVQDSTAGGVEFDRGPDR